MKRHIPALTLFLFTSASIGYLYAPSAKSKAAQADRGEFKDTEKGHSAQEEQRRKAQEEQRRKAQEEQRRKAQEEQRRKAQEERRKQQEEQRRKEQEEQRRRQSSDSGKPYKDWSDQDILDFFMKNEPFAQKAQKDKLLELCKAQDKLKMSKLLRGKKEFFQSFRKICFGLGG